MNQYLKREFAKGNNPTPEEQAKFIQSQVERMNIEGRTLKKMKGFFNFKYGFYINATGYTENKERKNEAYINAMNLKMQNPAIVNEPEYRQFLEDNNIKAFRRSQDQLQQFASAQQGGGAMPQQGKPDALLSQVKE